MKSKIISILLAATFFSECSASGAISKSNLKISKKNTEKKCVVNSDSGIIIKTIVVNLNNGKVKEYLSVRAGYIDKATNIIISNIRYNKYNNVKKDKKIKLYYGYIDNNFKINVPLKRKFTCNSNKLILGYKHIHNNKIYFVFYKLKKDFDYSKISLNSFD